MTTLVGFVRGSNLQSSAMGYGAMLGRVDLHGSCQQIMEMLCSWTGLPEAYRLVRKKAPQKHGLGFFDGQHTLI